MTIPSAPVDIGAYWRAAQLSRLAMDVRELAARAGALGLDGVAGQLRLVRTEVEQAGRVERDGEVWR